MAKIRLKNPGKAVAWLIRTVAATLRINVVNLADLETGSDRRHIWVFWHNRMFLMPWMHAGYFPGRPAAILSSASGDGAVIAQTCEQFGFKAVRGSSSRGGAKAMREMAGLLRDGYDLGITPDGPRGPRYQLDMGVIKLAQLTGTMVLPVHVRYEKSFRFNTWDGFLLPLPFSAVRIQLGPCVVVPRHMTAEECEAERANLERIMIEGTGE